MKPKRTNVRSHLEHIDMILDAYRKHEKRYGREEPIPDIIHDELMKILLVNKAILLKHAQKNTRKDIYVGVSHETS